MPQASSSGERDRDAAGRARNARPRDALGRPLPYGSPDVARQPEGIPRTPDETIDEAQRLLDAGLPFHAHEVFEDAWKSSTGRHRAMWKGMAQLAVGLTHLGRGNLRGARTLLQRGRDAITPFAGESPFGVDIAGVIDWSAGLTAELERRPSTDVIPWAAPHLRTRS